MKKIKQKNEQKSDVGLGVFFVSFFFDPSINRSGQTPHTHTKRERRKRERGEREKVWVERLWERLWLVEPITGTSN